MDSANLDMDHEVNLHALSLGLPDTLACLVSARCPLASTQLEQVDGDIRVSLSSSEPGVMIPHHTHLV